MATQTVYQVLGAQHKRANQAKLNIDCVLVKELNSLTPDDAKDLLAAAKEVFDYAQTLNSIVEKAESKTSFEKP